jgi:5-methylcytosine-specific restriction endonuclease McrA
MQPRREFPDSVKKAVRERAGYRCEYPECDNSAIEVDHIIPEALGGTSTYDNAQLLCTACHARKTKLNNKMVLKADKKGGRVGQYARRKKRGGSSIPAKKNAWPPKGSRKIVSRGFEKR